MFIDITGQRFGKLIALEPTPIQKDKRRYYYWKCKCDCGNECYIEGSSLRSGHAKSCGCIVHKHGMAKTRLYAVWNHMKQRCCNPKNKCYETYGARGIKVCDEWSSPNNGFVAFRDWAIKNGYRDDLTIERIDVNRGYSPDNCKWIPMIEQAFNKTTTLRLEIDGEIKTIRELSDEYGITQKCLRNRITRYGMTAKDAVMHKKHAKIIQSNG